MTGLTNTNIFGQRGKLPENDGFRELFVLNIFIIKNNPYFCIPNFEKNTINNCR